VLSDKFRSRVARGLEVEGQYGAVVENDQDYLASPRIIVGIQSGRGLGCVFRNLIEAGNFLLFPILIKPEILFFEIAHRLTAFIQDNDLRCHHIHIYAHIEGSSGLRGGLSGLDGEKNTRKAIPKTMQIFEGTEKHWMPPPNGLT